MRRDYIKGIAPVVSREPSDHNKVFLRCEWWDDFPMIIAADEAGCLYYSLHRESRHKFNAVGWPVSGDSAPSRFWTNLIGCNEKP